MDFNDTQDEAEFRKEARAWLEANAELKTNPNQAYGTHMTDAERVQKAREWQKTKLKGGFGAIAWPKMVGGRGGTPMHEVIYREEEGKFNVPAGFFNVSLGMVIPSVMTHASNSIRMKHLMPSLSGDELWCQLLSEPNAGSDLGMVRTKAERTTRDGVEGWLINGQKVWTTLAQYAEYGLVLARTDPSKPKFKGMTTFYVDMKDPGIEVRPIKQASGGEEFNEVFLNDVFVPDSQRVGDENNGWKVTITGLNSERMSIGGVMPADLWKFVGNLMQENEFHGKPAMEEGSLRERWVDLYLNAHGLWLMQARALTLVGKGEQPGAEMGVAKNVIARTLQDFSYLAMDIKGQDGLLDQSIHGEEWDMVERLFYGSAGMRIAGGTDEIVKNGVGERVLGLDPEPMIIDKNTPFQDLQK